MNQSVDAVSIGSGVVVTGGSDGGSSDRKTAGIHDPSADNFAAAGGENIIDAGGNRVVRWTAVDVRQIIPGGIGSAPAQDQMVIQGGAAISIAVADNRMAAAVSFYAKLAGLFGVQIGIQHSIQFGSHTGIMGTHGVGIKENAFYPTRDIIGLGAGGTGGIRHFHGNTGIMAKGADRLPLGGGQGTIGIQGHFGPIIGSAGTVAAAQGAALRITIYLNRKRRSSHSDRRILMIAENLRESRRHTAADIVIGGIVIIT
ncbi:MAG: hypothetical protein BWY71_00221 [Planctomycetes bacterium ADurb.Bin412]|nr:MAG: hypothetical protein BWY71_00221 [Planctomycetes bacterium ADurb.Bin412]